MIPFAVGTSHISTTRFVLFNVLGAMVWAAVIGEAGYLFGDTAQAIIGNVQRYEIYFFAGIASIGALVWILFFLLRRKKKRAS